MRFSRLKERLNDLQLNSHSTVNITQRKEFVKMVDAVASYGIHEYAPVTAFCSCCGAELAGDQDIYEIDAAQDIYYCEDCFRQYCIDNLDLDKMAKMLHVRIREASYLYE